MSHLFSSWRKAHPLGSFAIALISILATIVVTLIIVNFRSAEKKVKREIPALYAVDDPQFQRTMGNLLGPAILPGNSVESLLDGDKIFSAMLKEIHAAKKTITFETYIYWSETIGKEFADALVERARAGVKVHVLIDWVGSGKMDDAQIQAMELAGVEIRKFRPLKWYNLGRLNNRTHRKLLIVDGSVGFTGGVGIADQWRGVAQDPAHWRDTHFRLQGPAVAQMQAVFMDNWIKTTGNVLHGEDYFPAIAAAGTAGMLRAQMFSSSPAGGAESMALMYLLAVTAAKKSINIENSYFVPDVYMQRALLAAAKRGVKVRIIVPGPHMDVETVRLASRGSWGPLLEAGIEIYEFQPTMFHCKVMVVDELMVSVGSTNIDDRSFRLNDEANLNIFDRSFALTQIDIFRLDLQRSKRVEIVQWKNRPLREKIVEHIATLIGPML